MRFINSYLNVDFAPNVTMRTAYMNTYPRILIGTVNHILFVYLPTKVCQQSLYQRLRIIRLKLFISLHKHSGNKRYSPRRRILTRLWGGVHKSLPNSETQELRYEYSSCVDGKRITWRIDR